MRLTSDWLSSDHPRVAGVARAVSGAVERLRELGVGLDDERNWGAGVLRRDGFSFIERFGIAGSAGVLILMGVLGAYGFASLLGIEPDDSLIRLPGAAGGVSSGSDAPTGPVGDEGVQPQASPSESGGDGQAAGQTPTATPQETSAPPQQLLPLFRADAQPGRAGAAPVPSGTAAATPAPQSTPAPGAPAPDQPTPTPPAADCTTGLIPELTENGNQVRFTYGAVLSFQAGILVVDVAGTVLPLVVTSGTNVRGVLDAATVVTGQAHHANDGSIIAQVVEVVCPEAAR